MRRHHQPEEKVRQREKLVVGEFGSVLSSRTPLARGIHFLPETFSLSRTHSSPFSRLHPLTILRPSCILSYNQTSRLVYCGTSATFISSRSAKAPIKLTISVALLCSFPSETTNMPASTGDFSKSVGDLLGDGNSPQLTPPVYFVVTRTTIVSHRAASTRLREQEVREDEVRDRPGEWQRNHLHHGGD